MQSMQPPHSMQPQGGKHPPRALRPKAMPPRPLEPDEPRPAAVQHAPAQPSHTIARLVGPVLVMIGTGMVANGATYRVMAGQFLAGLPFIYFAGILMLVAGLAILNAHPQWTPDWRSAVTAVGWILTCVGAFRIIAPQFANFVARAAIDHTNFFTSVGVVLLAAGGFITFKGYVE